MLSSKTFGYQFKPTLTPLSVLRLSPINPGILVPGQTLALLPPWPMFPPLLWVFVTPWDLGIPWKPHLFITPWKPRNFLQVAHQLNCKWRQQQMFLRESKSVDVVSDLEVKSAEWSSRLQTCFGGDQESGQQFCGWYSRLFEYSAILFCELKWEQ